MPGKMTIDKSQLNEIDITQDELKEFEEFNKNSQFAFYYLFYRIFTNKYHILINMDFLDEYQEIEELYDFLFYFKHVIDTFYKQLEKDKLKKYKKCNYELLDDPLITFLVVLRNYIEHNPFDSIKKEYHHQDNEKRIIFKVSDVYDSIIYDNYKETLKFLKDENREINVLPLIIEGYKEVLEYILKILYEYYSKEVFNNMGNILKKLHSIQLDVDNIEESCHDLDISYGLELYMIIMNNNRSFSSKRYERIQKNSFLMDVFI